MYTMETCSAGHYLKFRPSTLYHYYIMLLCTRKSETVFFFFFLCPRLSPTNIIRIIIPLRCVHVYIIRIYINTPSPVHFFPKSRVRTSGCLFCRTPYERFPYLYECYFEFVFTRTVHVRKPFVQYCNVMYNKLGLRDAYILSDERPTNGFRIRFEFLLYIRKPSSGPDF